VGGQSEVYRRRGKAGSFLGLRWIAERSARETRTSASSLLDELDAIKTPLDVKKVKVDQLGRSSQRRTGPKAEVAINPDTGNIVSVNPTSTKKAERLLRRMQGVQ